jgi:hypothetical protein
MVIPTLFMRLGDLMWTGKRRVVDCVTPGCEWVLAKEGRCFKLGFEEGMPNILTPAISAVTGQEPIRHFFIIRLWIACEMGARGLLWIHDDGRVAQITRHDFGYAWPPMMMRGRG